MEEENEEKVDNTGARAAQRAELEKLGIKPAPEVKEDGEDSELDEDEDEELDESESEESEDEEEDSEDDDKKEKDDEDEEEDEEEDGQSHKKKGISFKQFNEVRSELREARSQIKELIEKGTKEAEKIPDDFMKRTEDLAKEIGVENPDGLKKIMSLVQEVVKGSRSELEKKLSDLEEKYSEVVKDAPIKDNFEGEWKTFVKSDFSKEFPNATAEELEKAQELMDTLSHDRKTGGRVYKDDKGRELLDPYELDYIYFKNKDRFQEIVSGKKSKGMEESRTQGIRSNREGKDEYKPLSKNASTSALRDYEKRSARAMEGIDNLSEPVDDTI